MTRAQRYMSGILMCAVCIQGQKEKKRNNNTGILAKKSHLHCHTICFSSVVDDFTCPESSTIKSLVEPCSSTVIKLIVGCFDGSLSMKRFEGDIIDDSLILE